MATALVVYFSATGTTEGVANYIAQATGGELHELVPEVPYSTADLDFTTDGSRVNQERDDPGIRPAIAESLDNLDEYEVVFLGYPIWYEKAPNIIFTFLEGQDVSDKTIVSFVTSGSTGIGSSAMNLERLTSETTNWVHGTGFGANTSPQEVVTWVESLDLPAISQQG